MSFFFSTEKQMKQSKLTVTSKNKGFTLGRTLRGWKPFFYFRHLVQGQADPDDR